MPPARPAARHHLVERNARDDALVGLAPGRIEHARQGDGVFGFRAAYADDKVAHGFKLNQIGEPGRTNHRRSVTVFARPKESTAPRDEARRCTSKIRSWRAA